MLYTNEPANKIMVALSAYRATNSEHTNRQRQLVLLNTLKAGGFEILDDNMIGCYREEGQTEHSLEESVMILCNDMLEVGLIARLTKEGFQQDCVLAVTTQTHSARFVTYNEDAMNKLTECDPIVKMHLDEYEEYFNSLQDGEEALSFREWLEAIS